jgi:hypothetical protein
MDGLLKATIEKSTQRVLGCTILAAEAGEMIGTVQTARIFTTVSTEEKAALSREAAADVVINYLTDDFASPTDTLATIGLQVGHYADQSASQSFLDIKIPDTKICYYD